MGRSHSITRPVAPAYSGAGTPERYSAPAVILHWLMAVLLIAQLAMGLYMVELPKRTPEVAYYYNLHKSLGLVALMLIAVRLWWRMRAPPPRAIAHTSALQEKAAALSHRLLYACMVLIPLFGFIGSSFGKYPVKFFGYALPRFGWEDPALQGVFRVLHASAAWLLCALIAVHVLAALYHGRTVLRRMLFKAG